MRCDDGKGCERRAGGGKRNKITQVRRAAGGSYVRKALVRLRGGSGWQGEGWSVTTVRCGDKGRGVGLRIQNAGCGEGVLFEND